MTLRQLRYFLKIAELSSFSQAASVLRIAQPALSRQIKQLEEELGAALFNRTDRGVTLTDAGRLLNTRGPSLMRDVERLGNDVRALALTPTGTLRIGMGMAVRDLLTTPTLAAFRDLFPKVGLHVHESVTSDLVEQVRSGRIDCATAFDLEHVPHLVSEPFVRETLFLIGAPSAGLQPTRSVSLSDVSQRALVCTDERNPLRIIVETALSKAGLPMNVLLDANAIDITIDMVARGAAFSVLPYSAVWNALRTGRVSAAPVVALTTDWTFLYAKDFGLPLAAQKFRDCLLENVRERISSGEWVSAQAL